jgi:hypothetical protein
LSYSARASAMLAIALRGVLAGSGR